MTIPQTIHDISWSHSALDTADKCLRTYYEQRVAKTVKQGESAALHKGNAMHLAIETWLKRGVQFEQMGLPGEILGELQRFQWAFDQLGPLLEAGDVVVEEKLAIDAGGNPCGFWDKHFWGRGALDLQIKFPAQQTVLVEDWKSGKVWPSLDQAQRYAEFVFAANPWCTKVIVQFAYVTANALAPAYIFWRYDADMIGGLNNGFSQKRTTPRAKLLDRTKLTLHKILTSYQTGIWGETKNVGCRWCPVEDCTTRNQR